MTNELHTATNEVADLYGTFVINEEGMGCRRKPRLDLLEKAVKRHHPGALSRITEELADLLKTRKKIEEEYSGLMVKYFIYPAQERFLALKRAQLCYQMTAAYGEEEAVIRGLAMDTNYPDLILASTEAPYPPIVPESIDNDTSMEIASQPVTPPNLLQRTRLYKHYIR